VSDNTNFSIQLFKLNSWESVWKDEWYAITIVINLIRKFLLNRNSFLTHRLFCFTNQYFCIIVTSHLETSNRSLWSTHIWLLLSKPVIRHIDESFHWIEFVSSIFHAERKDRIDTARTKTKREFESSLNETIFDQIFWISNEIFSTF
jgi:hypothetical protein